MNPELSADIDVTPDSVQVARPPVELARWVATVFTVLLVLGAAVLWWRRAAGALSSPPEPAALLLAGALLATAAASARTAWQWGTERQRTGLRGRSTAGAVSAAVLATGAALSLPGTSTGGLVTFWGILAIEECWAWGPAGWRRILRHRRGWLSVAPGEQLGNAQRLATHPVASAPAIPAFDGPPVNEVTQQITRRSAADGGEILSGWLRVPMAAGQRSTSVHLAFCPPFSRTPKVTVEQLAGPPARIRTVQRLPYGARFDLKLVALSKDAETMLLHFSAEAGPVTPDRDAKAREGESAPEA